MEFKRTNLSPIDRYHACQPWSLLSILSISMHHFFFLAILLLPIRIFKYLIGKCSSLQPKIARINSIVRDLSAKRTIELLWYLMCNPDHNSKHASLPFSHITCLISKLPKSNVSLAYCKLIIHCIELPGRPIKTPLVRHWIIFCPARLPQVRTKVETEDLPVLVPSCTLSLSLLY